MLEEGTRGMSQSCMDHEGPVWRFVPEPDETATLGDPIEGNQDGGTGVGRLSPQFPLIFTQPARLK